ncbi:uncharacterized protein L203_100084 [Cryptococcus depauperatus CBS 7841]|uniref:Protein ROT1 n=1 Tax=Cryptococcus depauperatus CBS 7841 TaxID=1295531 RepID=A0AAJ8LY68_9TREE
MLLALIASQLIFASISGVFAQGDLSAANNLTDLEGTWTSNTAVSTGGDICNPAEMKFNYPKSSGISYSFTNNGFFEEVRYQYNSNATNPSCIQAYISWQHGTYSLNDNGSISLFPFSSDGRIQVQDPCAATTNVITYYNNQVLFSDWGITVDPSTGQYILQLNRFDGAKLARMFLAAKPPNMLPTQYITGVNASGQTNTRKRSFVSSPIGYFKRSTSSADPRVATALTGGQALGLLGLLGHEAIFFQIQKE